MRKAEVVATAHSSSTWASHGEGERPNKITGCVPNREEGAVQADYFPQTVDDEHSQKVFALSSEPLVGC